MFPLGKTEGRSLEKIQTGEFNNSIKYSREIITFHSNLGGCRLNLFLFTQPLILESLEYSGKYSLWSKSED